MTLESNVFGPVVEQAANPGVNDDSDAGFGIGVIWINTVTNDVFLAANVSIGAAVWRGPMGRARALVFAFPDEDLSVAVFLPRPSFMLLDKFPVPTAEANQRFTVTAGTAGTGTNTIVLESTTTNPFTGSPSWTVQATVNLGTAKAGEVDGAFTSDWVWNPATEYLRVRCSAVGGAPKDVQAVFDYD